MEWLLEHIELVLPAALILYYMFQQVMARPTQGADLEEPESEETRRIQEEIRRKIVARQQGIDLPPPPPPPLAYQGERRRKEVLFPRQSHKPEEIEVKSPPLRMETEPRLMDEMRAFPRAYPKPEQHLPRQATPTAVARDFQSELRSQRERLREAQRQKEEAIERARAREAARLKKAAPVADAIRISMRRQLLADLSAPQSRRRAFLLKEVLDQPVSARGSPTSFSEWAC